MSKKFGLIDYWRMLRKRGPRLPTSYFFNAHLFDLVNKTDTHFWLPKDRYTQRPPNFDNGVLYMTSWTYEVRRSFNFLKRNKILDDEYVFIDVGCGKGKVCLLWAIFERKNNRSKSSIIGLDYYEHFVAISRENHLKLFGTPGFFLNVDATDFDFSSIKGQVIVYLYNPFDQKVLKQVVDNLPVNTIIIYNNPVHIAVFSQGYEVIYQHIGWHPNVQTTIIKKTTSSSLQP